MWILAAVGSALFAGITAILSKCGIKKTNSDVATAVRTGVVLVMAWLIVFITGAQAGIAAIGARSWLFLILSGLATGASWVCYFKALSLCEVPKVAAVDKSSAVLSVLCAGGFIAAASVLLCVLEDLYLLRPLQNLLSLCLRPFGLESCAAGTASGLIEATRGCAALAGGGKAALPFAAFLITFGGASILTQQLASLTKVGVRAGRFIAVKAAQGAAAFAFCLLLHFL